MIRTVDDLQAGIGILLVRGRRDGIEPVALSARSWTVSIGLAWFAMGATLAVTLIWLRHGVELD